MQLEWISGAITVVGVLFLFVGALTLLKKSWFMSWLRGTFGLFFIVVACFFGLLAFNVFSYQHVIQEEPIAIVSFEKEGDQNYSVVIEEPGIGDSRFMISGDLWQIDVRLLKWKGFISALGIGPEYKLGRLQGRYISLKQERSSKRTVYDLKPEELGFDVWETIQKQANWLPFVDAVYGSATFLPMSDGATYQVSIAATGLVARPLNDQADSAVKSWN